MMRWRVIVAVFALAVATSRAACEPCDRPSTAGLVPAMTGLPGQFDERRAGVEVDARWRIPVSTDGWYRVTQPQLIAAGLASNQVVGAGLRLFTRTQEVAILVSTTNVMGAGDAFYFYGLQHDGPHSRTNVYWLGLGSGGRRVQTISAAPQGGENLVTSVCFSAAYHPKLLYRPFHRPDDEGIDHWFAALVTHTAGTNILLNTSNRLAGVQARLSLDMYGLTSVTTTNPDHRTLISIGGVSVGSPTYDGPVAYSTNFLFDAGALTSGMSTVQLRQTGTNVPGVSQDQAYLVSLRVDYQATNVVRGLAHGFCGVPGTNRYRVTSVATNGGFWLLDVTDPAAPVLLENVLVTNNATVEFRHVSADTPRLLLVQTGGVRSVASVEPVAFRMLSDTNRSADYLLITPYEFRQQAYRLARHRFTNGLRIAVAPLPDIYNEFGYGVVDADAIKQFIGYAYHHWTPPRPRFALLVGEGTFDPLGFIGTVPTISVPVKFGATPFVYAPMDSWYGLVDGTTNGVDNTLIDVAIGRISISSNAPLSNVVNKTIAYEFASVVNNALLVSDVPDSTNDFWGSSETYIFSSLTGTAFSSFQRSANAVGGTFNFNTISNNFGRRLVTYVGHGAVDRWSAQNVLNATSIQTMANTTYPLVAIFSCQNGSFIDRATNSLAEVMIEAPRAAAAVYCPTALSIQLYADYLAGGFTKSLAQQQRRYLGDVVLDANLNLWNFNKNVAELRTYQIIGDPGLIVNRPGTLPP